MSDLLNHARPLSHLKVGAPPRYLLAGGTIRAGRGFTAASSLLVADGIVEAVDPVEVGSDVPVYDLGGTTVLPGLHDTHFHMMSTGANRRAVDLYDAGSIEGVLAMLAASPTADGTDWVIAGQLDESRLDEGRAPTLAELDRACPDRPLYVNDRGLHYSLVNSVAAGLLGLEQEARDHDGRMQENLSGLAKERLGGALPRSYAEDCLQFAAQHAADLGLTTLHAIEGGELFDDRDVHVLRDVCDRLPVRVHLLWSTQDVEAIDAAGLRWGGGDVCADGSIGSHTARLTQDYADAPGERGVTLRDVDTLTDIFTRAERAGIQFGVHAIGDVGVEAAVTAIERAAAPGNPLRHRIEHFGMPTAAVIERAAAAGIGISTQPGFAFLRGQQGGVYHSRLGDERLAAAYPLRTLLDAGLVVSGGSDSDVTSADPFLGLHSAVNHPQVAERVDVREALTMYTASAVWMAGGDPETAYVSAGTPADLTICDSDPFKVEPDAIRSITAVATVVAGRSVGR